VPVRRERPPPGSRAAPWSTAAARWSARGAPVRPLSALLTITSGDPERTVAETTSDTDGHFRVALPPGTYTVRPANLTGAVAPIAQPVSVTVTSGRFTTIVIPFDSGIR
jgi:hypothetical protein